MVTQLRQGNAEQRGDLGRAMVEDEIEEIGNQGLPKNWLHAKLQSKRQINLWENLKWTYGRCQKHSKLNFIINHRSAREAYNAFLNKQNHNPKANIDDPNTSMARIKTSKPKKT